MSKDIHSIASRVAMLTLLVSIFDGFPVASWAKGPAQSVASKERAEKFVLSQLSNGDEADLSDLHDPAHQSVSAGFVEDLLIGKLDANLKKKRGIAILNAHIDGDLILSQADVRYAVSLNECIFSGLVDISGAHFFHDLSFRGSRFEKNVEAGQLKVDGDLTLRWSQFTGDIDFAAASIGGSLYAGGMQSLKPGGETEFDYSKVATITELSNIKLNGPLRLTGADLQILLLRRDPNLAPGESTEAIDQLGLVDLEGTIIRRNLEIQGKKIDTLYAPSLNALGTTSIQDVNVTGEVDFEGAHFADLSFGDKVTWPAVGASIRLAGITFARLSPEFARESSADPHYVDGRWRWLLDGWIDRAEYSPQTYQQLETAYKNAGRPTLGDDTFEKMKHREREDGHLSLLDWVANWLQEWVIGYGREPQYALLWGLPIIGFGCFIFRTEYMIPMEPGKNSVPYNPFWYSFEVFLPLVKLQCADHWTPKPDDKFRVNYMRVHSMLGWLLVPFTIAALTGLVNGK